ncbi:MAG TPA: RecQ family ATP-dependent DNA helicase [Ktedonobacteraceae bacterium]|nr:RecQ family ATP-dependent DNA helicase [Ktedonobacteraceae bacterium]
MTYSWSQNPPEQLLFTRFKLQSFHPDQREIIEQLVQGEHKRVLAIQRTGWGKSLCYQLASLYFPHLTLVFSPLKALMRDQCQRCNEVYQIPAAIVSSDFSEEQNCTTLAQAVAGQLKILYIAPERLDNLSWRAYVQQMRMSMIVIDEAHCISTWGHDFRPHYRRIVRLLEALPSSIPVLALTATANQRVEQDILQQIGNTTRVIRGSMCRPNLQLHTIHLKGDREKLSYLAANLPTWSGSGIVYTGTQDSAEMAATFLQQQGIKAEYYHAGREDDTRQEIEHGLIENRYKVVCSTNALGMGIDKPDIRFVVHYHIPASPIHYYQEIGRAGRDGNVACCILFFDPEDLAIQQHFISGAKPPGKQYETVLALVKSTTPGLRMADLLRITGFPKNALQHILTDLEEQELVKHIKQGSGSAVYISGHLGRFDFSMYEHVRAQKQQELADLQRYTQIQTCSMDYLTAYLGDPAGYSCGVCGNCRPENFLPVHLSDALKEATTYFIEQSFLPRIKKRGTIKQPGHEAGWSLSYHGTTRVGKLVRASKYENAGLFAEELVSRSVDLIRTRYPLHEIQGIVSVPPTVSGNLVEDFARRIATGLGVVYIPALTKQRSTKEQKICTNFIQKQENVKGAFTVVASSLVTERVLLLIDDIYDSGYILREAAMILMKAGAQAVYPFTITRTLHSDDQ